MQAEILDAITRLQGCSGRVVVVVDAVDRIRQIVLAAQHIKIMLGSGDFSLGISFSEASNLLVRACDETNLDLWRLTYDGEWGLLCMREEYVAVDQGGESYA